MNVNKKWRKFVVGFDPHGDMQDERANESFFKFVRQWSPEIRVCGGDLWDFRCLRKKASEEERRDSMAVDYQMGIEWMNKLKTTHYIRGNHCLDRRTEILTSKGWERIDSLQPDALAAQVGADNTLTYARPLRFVETGFKSKMIEIKGALTWQIVTPEHSVIVDGKKFAAKNLVGCKIKASSIAKSANLAYSAPDDISDDWIRLITWFVMDGTFVDSSLKNPKHTKARLQFKLSLPKKIDILKSLLDRMQIPYTFKMATKSGINKLQPYRFCIYGDWARRVLSYCHKIKQLPEEWVFLSKSKLNVFLEELSVTDGSKKDACISWNSINLHNVNIVSRWCAHRGVDMSVTPVDILRSGFKNAKPQWRVMIKYRDNKNDSQYLSIKEIDYNDRAYCVTMPEGTIVTRFNGRPAVTGNCERLWDLAEIDNGIASDYARELVAQTEAKLTKMRCQMFPYDKRSGVLRIGHLKVIHGFLSGVTAARRTALTYGSVIMGHGHSIQAASIEGLEPRTGMMCGCLCKLDHGYNRAQVGSLMHEHGWAYGVVSDTGSYHVWQARKIEDKWLLPTGIEEL